MLGWLRRKEPTPLVFKDNLAAFDYACRHLDNRILLEAVLPALVEETGKSGEEGERCFRLRLADSGGGRDIWACTLKEATDHPEVGDLVGFKVVKIAPDLPADMAVIGYIAVKLEPVLVGKRGWRIAWNYTPQNIKPVLRL